MAEMLIVVIVLGTIASLVIPPIIHDTQDAEFKTAFKNIYSNLADVTRQIVLDNHGSLENVFKDPDGGGSLTINDDFRDKYLNYLNYIKKCDDSVTSVVSQGGRMHMISNCWSRDNYF